MSEGVLYFDGSSKPHTDKSGGWGFVLLSGGEKEERGERVPAPTTNNICEYSAMIQGMIFAAEKGIKYLTVIGDSQVVIFQMTGKYKIKNPELQKLNSAAQGLVKQFTKIQFEWKRREHNLADEFSR